MFLIVFDLIFQMEKKSRRLISKKGRKALVDLIINRRDFFLPAFFPSERAGQILSETLVSRF